MGPFGEPVENIIRALPSVAMVLAAEDIDLEAEPEEGEGRRNGICFGSIGGCRKKGAKSGKEGSWRWHRWAWMKAGPAFRGGKTKSGICQIQTVRGAVFDAEAAAERPPERPPRPRPRSGRRRRRQPTAGSTARDELLQDLKPSDD